MEFRDIGRALRRNVALIVAILVVAVGAAVAYSAVERPSYESTAKVLYGVDQSPSLSDFASGNEYLVLRVQMLSPLVDSPMILDPVIERLGLDTTPAKLAPFVSAASEGVGTTLAITATSSDPAAAKDLATAVMDSMTEQVTDFEAGALPEGADPSQLPEEAPVELGADVVQPATEPSSPTTPDWTMNLLIGLAAGLVVAAAAVTIRTLTDPRVRDASEMGDITVLASIPAGKRTGLDVVTKSQSQVAEGYRKLRTALKQRLAGQPSPAVLVASPSAGAGSEAVALNLSAALAESGDNVTLIDADFRGSSIAKRLDLGDSAGLAEVIEGRSDLSGALRLWSDTGVRVLAAGSPERGAGELLTSPKLEEILGALSSRGGIVVLNAPAVLPYADAAALAERTRGALLVTRRGHTRKRDVAAAAQALRDGGAHVIGAAYLDSAPVPEAGRR